MPQINPRLTSLVALNFIGQSGKVLSVAANESEFALIAAGGGSGTVTSVSVTTANGVSGTVATATTTPAITLTLGAITPSSVAASGAVTGSNLSGTNTGDQTITLTGNVTGSGAGSFATTIANNVVTDAMLATVATATFKGRATAATGNVETLTGTQATTLLDLATGSLKGLMSSADFTKLGGIATGATANSSDATLLARANHTGTQAGSTVTGAYTAAGMTMATARLLGRTTAAAGAAEEISIGAGLTLSAGVLDRVTQTTVSGNAGSATILQTPRNISITGKVTAAGGTFDGSAALAINVTAVTLVAGDIPNIAESQVTNLTTDLAAKAPLASPVFTGMIYFQQPTPTAKTAAATLTIAELLTGIVTYNGVAAALTLPTGTLTDAGILSGTLANDRALEWAVINTGAATATMTAGVGHTYVGAAGVLAATSARFWTRKTATNTFVTYRTG